MTTKLRAAIAAGFLAVGVLVGAAGTIVVRDATTPQHGDMVGMMSMMGKPDMARMMDGAEMAGMMSMMGGADMAGMMGSGSSMSPGASLSPGASMTPDEHGSHHASPSPAATR